MFNFRTTENSSRGRDIWREVQGGAVRLWIYVSSVPPASAQAASHDITLSATPTAFLFCSNFVSGRLRFLALGKSQLKIGWMCALLIQYGIVKKYYFLLQLLHQGTSILRLFGCSSTKYEVPNELIQPNGLMSLAHQSVSHSWGSHEGPHVAH